MGVAARLDAWRAGPDSAAPLDKSLIKAFNGSIGCTWVELTASLRTRSTAPLVRKAYTSIEEPRRLIRLQLNLISDFR